MKLREDVCGERDLRTCRRKTVKKLIVAFRLAIPLSPPMDSTISLHQIISFSHIYTSCQKMRIGFCCPLTHRFKTCLPTPMNWHRLLHKSHTFLLSSSDTVGIISLLLFSASYVNILYFLDPQLLACTPIKLGPLISHRDA